MVNKEKVLAGLKSCADSTGALCRTCPYDFVHNENCMGDMARDALELLKSLEAALPMDSVMPGTTYQRLMAIKVELEDKNHALTTEVRELRRLNESLSNLCHNLLKRLAKYE